MKIGDKVVVLTTGITGIVITVNRSGAFIKNNKGFVFFVAKSNLAVVKE